MLPVQSRRHRILKVHTVEVLNPLSTAAVISDNIVIDVHVDGQLDGLVDDIAHLVLLLMLL